MNPRKTLKVSTPPARAYRPPDPRTPKQKLIDEIQSEIDINGLHLERLLPEERFEYTRAKTEGTIFGLQLALARINVCLK